MFFLLALYFDNICVQNRGTSQPWYFFIKPSYWCSRACSRRALLSKTTKKKAKKAVFEGMELLLSSHKNTAVEEKRQVKQAEREDQECHGVRIVGLSKTY